MREQLISIINRLNDNQIIYLHTFVTLMFRGYHT